MTVAIASYYSFPQNSTARPRMLAPPAVGDYRAKMRLTRRCPFTPMTGYVCGMFLMDNGPQRGKVSK
jgi:hypothetical protein